MAFFAESLQKYTFKSSSMCQTAKKVAAKKKTASTGKRRSKASNSGSRKQRSAKKGLFRRLFGGLWWLFKLLLIPGVLIFAAVVFYLDREITTAFEGRRWQLPAQVFARPMELYEGQALSRSDLVEELLRLGYVEERGANSPGSFQQRGNTVLVASRPFAFWDGEQAEQRLKLVFSDKKILKLQQRDSGSVVPIARLDPPLIGSIHPSHGEDRILVSLKDVPPLLPAALIEIEDGDFEKHIGLDFSAIARAFLVNLKAGRVTQGGSTLTQQLVKNYFLSNERSYTRKIREALMSIILELRYSKEDILESYLNEVYLGQDGNRAIHGFGLAANFYFGKPVAELSHDQVAMLVAIVRGPTYYNPRRKAERAIKRRNHVLARSATAGLITKASAESATSRPLGVSGKGSLSNARYPAFLKLVRQQLREDYREEDLTSEGLRIFTTIDPRIQATSGRAMVEGLKSVASMKNSQPDLQSAMVITSTQGGEVLAFHGSRSPGYAGFNRALDARRPVGSLLKPAVYLTALERGYSLATPLQDTPVEYSLPDGTVWAPKNYNKQSNGPVLLYRALSRSLNLATVNLGLELGIDTVVQTLQRLGHERRPPAFGSLLLGAYEMSPFEVAQIYYPMAAGGFRTRLNSIREVLTAEGQPLRRYPLEVEPVIKPVPHYLMSRALQKVMREGTGRGVWRWLPSEFDVAGKSGTTDDLRDAWFAGFSGDKLAVVWVGRDDNAGSGLTGSSGALPIWGRVMRAISDRPLNVPVPEGVRDELVEVESGLLADEGCQAKAWLPFAAGTGPTEWAPCAIGTQRRYEAAPVSSDQQQNEPSGGSPWWQRVFE